MLFHISIKLWKFGTSLVLFINLPLEQNQYLQKVK